MNREPVVIITAIMSVLYVLVSFGVEVTDTQQAAIAAALTAIGALWARSKVSPTG